MRAAVIVHVFYPQLWAELAAAIRNIDVPRDLFVTYVDETAVCAARRDFPDAKFIRCENRGYDLWPFLCVLQDLPTETYDLVVKLHTKRDIDWDMPMDRQIFFGSVWRDKLLSFASSSPAWERTRRRLSRRDVGMVANADLVFDRRATGHRYEATFDRACDRMEALCAMRPPAEARYVAGTMFAARFAALKPLLRQRYSAEMFEVSRGHDRETFAHIMERMLGLSVYCAGFRIEGCGKSVAWHNFTSGRSPVIKFLRFFYKRQCRDWRLKILVCGIPVYSRPLRRPKER